MPTRKHIIIEGPDGGGKDTLIHSLMDLFPGHTQHKRASTSLGGPVPDLAAWVAQDVTTMYDQPASIYNRHPLISENIYAPYRQTDRIQEPEWRNPVWLNAMRRAAAAQSVLVLCLPPFATVRKTVRDQGPAAHMPGVHDNIVDIWMSYSYFTWPGVMLRYDYQHNTAERLAETIRYALARSRSLS